jgi:hypothetical protein
MELKVLWGTFCSPRRRYIDLGKELLTGCMDVEVLLDLVAFL